MRQLFVCAVIFFVMIAAFESSSAGTADQFRFQDEARDLLEQISKADTLRRIKLLTNIASSKRNDDREEAREEAQQLVAAFQQGHDLPLVDAYRWALRVIEIRDWGKLHKAWSGAKDLTKEAADSIAAVRDREPRNITIRFISANIAIEAARYIPELLEQARQELKYIDQHLLYQDDGALFFLELDWAKYHYWMVEKDLALDKEMVLLFAQYRLNRASHYAHSSFHRSEVAFWKEKIQKKKPKKVIWNKEVLKLIEDND